MSHISGQILKSGLLLAGLMIVSGSVLASDPAPRQAFLQHYEPHAANLASRYSNIRFRYRTTTPNGPNREQVQTVSGKFDFTYYLLDGGENAVVDLTTQIKTLHSRSVAGRNDRYDFTIIDKGEGRYALSETEIYSNGLESPRCLLSFPYADAWGGRTYLELAQDPETNILSTREVKWREQRVTEVHLEYTYYDRQAKQKKRGRGTYYFAPASGWVCVGERTDPEAGGEYYERVYTYDTTGAWAIPIRAELWSANEKKPEAKRLWVTEIEEFVSIPKMDPAEFRLSAFGLPEPVGVEWKKPTPRYLWFLVAAGAFVALAVGFRLLARRRTATASTRGVSGEKPNAPPP